MMFCQECGRPTDGQWVDFGIGPYEYWGRPGVDVRWDWVSNCCEATVVDEEGNVEEPPDVREDEDA